MQGFGLISVARRGDIQVAQGDSSRSASGSASRKVSCGPGFALPPDFMSAQGHQPTRGTSTTSCDGRSAGLTAGPTVLASECQPPPFGFLVPSAWGLRDRRGSNPHGNRVIRNLGTRGIVAIEGGASGGRKVSERGGEPSRTNPRTR